MEKVIVVETNTKGKSWRKISVVAFGSIVSKFLEDLSVVKV